MGALLSSSSTGIDAVIRAKFPGVRHMTTSQLQQVVDECRRGDRAEEVVLLDVRKPEEFAVSCLPGAAWVSPEAHRHPEQVRALLRQHQRKTVVCYCSVGYRSSQLAAAMMKESTDEQEASRIWNLDGSIFRWANEGRPVVDRDGQHIRRVHPYSPRWGRGLAKELHAYAAGEQAQLSST